MCMTQDPLSRAAMKIDPLARVDGRQKLSNKHGEKMDPLGTALSKNDPLSKSLGVDPGEKYNHDRRSLA